MQEEKGSRNGVVEWAKLKLIGRPLLAAASSGCSSYDPSFSTCLAIRPSPCLLHIYRCHCTVHLQELIQFPEDPTFLLFVPPLDSPPQQALRNDNNSINSKAAGWFLAITCDGSIWRIPIAADSSYDSVHPATKRLKHNHPQRLLNVSISSRTTSVPVIKQKRKVKDEWDVFEDCDIYKDIDLYSSQNSHIHVVESSYGKCIFSKSLKVHAHGRLPQRPEIRNIESDMLIGKFADAHLAAIGPNNLIAVASPSSGPVLFNGNPKSITSLPQSDLSNASMYGKPSCLLFLSCSKYKSQWCGPCLSEPLFNVFCPSNGRMKTDLLLLQGNIAGMVYVFPIQHRNKIAFPPTILCDLKEPICGLVATTLFKECDVLFVISSLGRIAAIAACRPVNTGDSSLGLISGFTNIFQVDLKDNISIGDWRIPGPVLSLLMIGSDCLCFCSASGVCLVNVHDINPMQSYGAQGIETSGKVTLKKSLGYNIIPLDEVFIALSGMGPSSTTTNNKTVVALTSRGRLIALDITDHLVIAQKEVFVRKKIDKFWKPAIKKREENVKDLIDEISAVDMHIEALQTNMKHVDCAIRELSLAIQLAYNVLRCRKRLTIRSPHQPPLSFFSGLGCNLEVHPVVLSVSEERLCFGPLPIQSSTSLYGNSNILDYKLHVKVILHNHTSYPISSFWTLMLELQHHEKTGKMSKIYFSNIINDGYGLAPGASNAINYDILRSENCISPMVASVFLFHLHESHNDVMSMEQMNGVSNNSFMRVGAVGILIARFRLDILCLLRKPKRLQHLSDNKSLSHMLNQTKLMPNNIIDGSAGFKPFSVKLKLRDKNCSLSSSTILDSVEKWKEFFLEDLVHFCNSSVDGEEVTGSDPNGNKIVFNLDGSHSDKPGLLLKEVQIMTDSLVLGCMVRESVLWRLLEGRNMCEHIVPIKGDIQQYMDCTVSSLMDTQRILDAIICDMENVDKLQLSDSSNQFGQVFDALEYIVSIYRNYREEALSGSL